MYGSCLSTHICMYVSIYVFNFSMCTVCMYACMQGKKKRGAQSEHSVWQWQEFMDFHIAGNGLCELLAEVALRHTDESCQGDHRLAGE